MAVDALLYLQNFLHITITTASVCTSNPARSLVQFEGHECLFASALVGLCISLIFRQGPESQVLYSCTQSGPRVVL
jgi:hypothetical protein